MEQKGDKIPLETVAAIDRNLNEDYLDTLHHYTAYENEGQIQTSSYEQSQVNGYTSGEQLAQKKITSKSKKKGTGKGANSQKRVHQPQSPDMYLQDDQPAPYKHLSRAGKFITGANLKNMQTQSPNPLTSQFQLNMGVQQAASAQRASHQNMFQQSQQKFQFQAQMQHDRNFPDQALRRSHHASDVPKVLSGHKNASQRSELAPLKEKQSKRKNQVWRRSTKPHGQSQQVSIDSDTKNQMLQHLQDSLNTPNLATVNDSYHHQTQMASYQPLGVSTKLEQSEQNSSQSRNALRDGSSSLQAKYDARAKKAHSTAKKNHQAFRVVISDGGLGEQFTVKPILPATTNQQKHPFQTQPAIQSGSNALNSNKKLLTHHRLSQHSGSILSIAREGSKLVVSEHKNIKDYNRKHQDLDIQANLVGSAGLMLPIIADPNQHLKNQKLAKNRDILSTHHENSGGKKQRSNTASLHEESAASLTTLDGIKKAYDLDANNTRYHTNAFIPKKMPATNTDRQSSEVLRSHKQVKLKPVQQLPALGPAQQPSQQMLSGSKQRIWLRKNNSQAQNVTRVLNQTSQSFNNQQMGEDGLRSKLKQKYPNRLIVEDDFQTDTDLKMSDLGVNDQVKSPPATTKRMSQTAFQTKLRNSQEHLRDGGRSTGSAGNYSQDEDPTLSKINLMKSLTKSRASVDQDSVMLINASEILTKTGIHGQIATVGVGFGTGRHTNKRQSTISPEAPIKPNAPHKTTTNAALHKTSRGDAKVPKLLISKQKDQQTSVRTHPFLKDQGQSALTQQKSNKGHSAMTKTSKPSLESQGVSAMTQKPVKKHEIALSARSSGPQKSFRSKQGQVTARRFSPHLFDAKIQTDDALMEEYFKKETATQEISTSPVQIKSPRDYAQFMVQTEPPIEERVYEPDPQSYHLPNVLPLDLAAFKATMVEAEPETVVDMPMPPEIEDIDWHFCSLFKFTRHIWLKHLISTGKITSDKRPETPKEYRGLSAASQAQKNLNPNERNILSYTECEYAAQLISKQLEEKKRQQTVQTQVKQQAQSQNGKFMQKLGHTKSKQQQAKRPTAPVERSPRFTEVTVEEIRSYYDRAKITIEVLIKNMIRPIVLNRVLFEQYKELTPENTIRLLFRAQQLYEARQEAMQLCRVMLEIENEFEPLSLCWRILQHTDSKQKQEQIKSLMTHLLNKISKATQMLLKLLSQYKFLKKDFQYNYSPLRIQLEQYANVVLGYFLSSGVQIGTVDQETGVFQLVEEAAPFDSSMAEFKYPQEVNAYRDWLTASIRQSGKLDSKTWVAILEKDGDKVAQLGKKQSRVAGVLESIPQEPVDNGPKLKKGPTMYRPITPIAEEPPQSDDLEMNDNSAYGDFDKADHRMNVPKTQFRPRQPLLTEESQTMQPALQSVALQSEYYLDETDNILYQPKPAALKQIPHSTRHNVQFGYDFADSQLDKATDHRQANLNLKDKRKIAVQQDSYQDNSIASVTNVTKSAKMHSGRLEESAAEQSSDQASIMLKAQPQVAETTMQTELTQQLREANRAEESYQDDTHSQIEHQQKECLQQITQESRSEYTQPANGLNASQLFCNYQGTAEMRNTAAFGQNEELEQTAQPIQITQSSITYNQEEGDEEFRREELDQVTVTEQAAAVAIEQENQ